MVQSRWARCIVVLLTCAFAAVLAGQSSNAAGALKGVITDAQGASIPGASLLLTNLSTSAATVGATQKDGSYVFPLLPPGNYTLKVLKSGFNTVTLTGLKVQIATVTTASTQLKVGTQSMEVTVSGAAQLVNTSTATTGDVITGKQIVGIPLPTRNFLQLMGLQANVVTPLQSAASSGLGSETVYASGSRATTNSYVLNGVDANNIASNAFGGAPVPNPDAVQEFKVSTSQYDASQGRASGGEINAVIKSGTSQFHGGAFEFYRDSVLNANDFFANRAGVPRPALQQNQFGGQIGGPVPKMARTFWFFSYQGTRQKNGISGSVDGSQPVLPSTRDAASLAQAFNIPVAQIDPVAVKWLNRPGPYGGMLYPSGTCVGVVGTCGPGSIGTYVFSSPTIFNGDQESASVDHDFSRKNHASLQWFHSASQSLAPTGGESAWGREARPRSTT